MEFTVQFKIRCLAEKQIVAKSWEAALEQAKEIKVPDLITHNGGDCFPDFDDPELSALIINN